MRNALLLLYLLVPFSAAVGEPKLSWDLVVYGGTAGGVATAVSAAREGLKVALLEQGHHLGGMVSGGLGATDFGKKEVIGGLSLEFFQRVGRHYGEKVGWYFEPHVAESVFREMAKEAGVTVFLQHRLREKGGVQMRRGRIEKVFLEDGQSFQARVFADATYEGDLMAQSGVSCTWGREGMSQYGESLAGVRDHTPYHQFTVRVSPYDSAGQLLPEVSPGPKGGVGAADKKVQAYNFRLCMTKVKANRVPFPRPPGYDPKRFELLARMLKIMTEEHGEPPHVDELMNPVPMPERKTDTNNNGAFSTDYIGGSWDYPEANYRQRAEIWQKHRDYVAGFLYFLANDPQVPDRLQHELSNWGLAKDEFVDNENWPHQLYVREARRMVGEYVMTQKDIQTDLVKPDSIGMGSYNSDSHNIQRIPTADGAVENEGDVEVPVSPYQIPYRLLLPKRQQVTNLLVPVCFSASHVAYSTLRMEPQYMIIGHAAGVAAKLAIERGLPVQDVDVQALQLKLKAQKAVLELNLN